MDFLPEDDRDYLEAKQLTYELKTESLPDGTPRRGIFFPAFDFAGNLFSSADGVRHSRSMCDLLILIPSGYATTRLDSFYTAPQLSRPDGTAPINTAVDQELFGRKWQFWSRHLAENEWRVGQDGLETYLQYVRGELRRA